MNKALIAEYFYDNFENILDECVIIVEIKRELLESNDTEFHDEIDHQSCDEFIRSICLSCANRLALSYESVYDEMEGKLEELYESFD